MSEPRTPRAPGDRKAPIRVLHVVPSFYPAVAYGGPIFSTKAITDGIAGTEGFAVAVLTTDTADPNSSARLDLPANPAILPPGYPVRYCRRLAGVSVSAELLWRLGKEIRRADVVHLTGPYNFPVIPTLLLCRAFRRPLVWSPRGGFQATAEWADAPKRRLKQAFETVYGWLRPRGAVLHVTAPVEAAASRNLGPVATAQIPNAIDVPGSLPPRDWRPDGLLRLAFLSRVHPKKGLDLLLEAMTALPAHVTLDIYGEGDATYVRTLGDRIAALGLTDRVVLRGHVDGAEKTAALTGCDLFVLPTHSENFGIVVAEALAHGTPVVVTTGAPWAGIDTHDCGRWVPIDAGAIRDAIAVLDGADLAAMGARGRDWMIADFSTAGMVRRFADLYRRLARPAP